MTSKKPASTATNATPKTTSKTTTTLHSISEMNELLIKAVKLIELYSMFKSNDDELSNELSNKLFDMFNKASYQDVKLFEYLCMFLKLCLDDEAFTVCDKYSDGDYYFELIVNRIKA